ncbi:MAG: S9 family peptidase [Chitinophagaceae bacterium]|nr:MAG: S9 family peptidase [Chitinophagaceae bacterium]
MLTISFNKRYFILLCMLFIYTFNFAQSKKPLTHDVYDGWKSIGAKGISDDGSLLYYTIDPQEGDGVLYIKNSSDQKILQSIDRGYSVNIIDNRYVVGKIKPFYSDTRTAKIKKKRPDEMTKDSLFIFDTKLGTLKKIANLRSIKSPESGNSSWVAYLLDTSTYKLPRIKKPSAKIDTVTFLSKVADSIIKKSIDSIKGKIPEEKIIKIASEASKKIYKNKDEDALFADDEVSGGRNTSNSYDLIIQNLKTNDKKTFQLVSDYYFDKNGNTILVKQLKHNKDSTTQNQILLYRFSTNKVDTIKRSFNEAKSFTSTEDGSNWAFLAEVDSSAKALQKFYKLYSYQSGQDSVKMIASNASKEITKGNTINDASGIRFSKDGSKLFFGVSTIRPPKDTTLVDFETAKLDIWHYQDDYLQPQQLKNISRELSKSNLYVYTISQNKMLALTNTEDEIETSLVDEGNASWILGQSNKGNRISSNWEGRTKMNAYVIDVMTGAKKLIQKDQYTFYQASPNGKFIIWYQPEQKAYFTYQIATGKIQNISSAIKQPIYDIENDVPDFPRAMGIAGWKEDDASIFIETAKDIWEVPLNNPSLAKNITNLNTKADRIAFQFTSLDREQRYFKNNDQLLFTAQNKTTKEWNLYLYHLSNQQLEQLSGEGFSIGSIIKAKNAQSYLVQKANIKSNELYVGNQLNQLTKLTDVSSQQNEYNWLSAELLKWKMFDGKMSEGILYKPENFDPTKKYPIIFYFYEKDADGLYSYKTPAPSASTINIPYFVSNGYLVFDPNIYYKDGEPGESAYNSIVSAAQFLSKKPWVDGKNMAIQGQSWGGYQVAYLVTRTNIFKAAGSGAPVSNMTSAYGGIRWGTGLVRAFQYEKQQSRIGATLWQRQDLYLKNSPLFHLPKVTTPLLIMHNDQDGAVPWYQGIELFTGLRRLGKQAWMLQYNDEDHNLKERRNRKDLSIRLGQFFDHFLKGMPAADWIKHGVPAVDKGKTWGLEIHP